MDSKFISHNFSKLYNALISGLNKCTITEPASTITQSHFGRPAGLGHLIPIFFNLRITSSAVESVCRLERQVPIIKKSAIEVLFCKSIILISSALASSKIALIFSIILIFLLMGTS